jgi:hypothetical protein
VCLLASRHALSQQLRTQYRAAGHHDLVVDVEPKIRERFQATCLPVSSPCGSSTNFFATPLSKSL